MAQSEAALFEYASNGYDVVIGHGFQFAEGAKKIHSQFPKTWFIINTAKIAEAPNLASFDNRWGDVGYVAGGSPGIMTKIGTIGAVGGIPVPVIQEYNEGFERGAKRMRPNAMRLGLDVGSFSDVAKGKEITLALIEKGADVVTATGNESVIGTLEAAKEKGVLMIGTAFDSASFAPDTVVTTALVNFDVNIDLAIGKILDGTIKPETYVLGFNENGIGLAGYGKFDERSRRPTRRKFRPSSTKSKQARRRDLPKFRSEPEPSLTPLLEVRGLTKIPTVTLRANDNVSFSIFPGEIVGIVGENGAGKSIFAKMLAGHAPEAATCTSCGKNGVMRRRPMPSRP